MLRATFAWGDVGAVLEHGTRSAALEGPGSPWYPVLTWALGWAHYCNDELDLAEQRLKETVALGPRAEQWIVAVASIADLSLIAGRRGRRAEQARLAEEAARLAGSAGSWTRSRWGRCTRRAASRWRPAGTGRRRCPSSSRGSCCAGCGASRSTSSTA